MTMAAKKRSGTELRIASQPTVRGKNQNFGTASHLGRQSFVQFGFDQSTRAPFMGYCRSPIDSGRFSNNFGRSMAYAKFMFLPSMSIRWFSESVFNLGLGWADKK